LIKLCKICGTEFTANRSRVYCSAECKKIGSNQINEESRKRKHDIRYAICLVCGIEFALIPYNAKVCSAECRNVQKQQKLKSKLVEKKCKFCGIEFTSNHHARVYCNTECSENAHKQLMAEIHRKKHVTKYAVCPICEVEFAVIGHIRKFCSAECRNIQKKQNIKPEFIEKKCVVCENTFMASRSVKFCSDKCRKKDKVKRQTIYFKNQKERIKLELEQIEKQKKQEFFNMFQHNDNKDCYKCSAGDFEFHIYFEAQKYYVKASQANMENSYNSKLHSKLEFDNKMDSIDFCYKIYTGIFNYTKDFNLYSLNDTLGVEEVMEYIGISKGEAYKLFHSSNFPKVTKTNKKCYVCKTEFLEWLEQIESDKANKKKNDIKKKIKFPVHLQDLIKKFVKNKDYKQMQQMIHTHINRKFKINIIMCIDEIIKITDILYDNFQIELLEDYLIKIICENLLKIS